MAEFRGRAAAPGNSSGQPVATTFPGRIVNRGFPDPSGLAEQGTEEESILWAFRTVRAQIRRCIESLPEALFCTDSDNA